ncbi:MAG: hypothetical protein N2Z73_02325 [Endomicrobia bacterium]|nr:hypothetical protein [Endomicrobiia bacterium]
MGKIYCRVATRFQIFSVIFIFVNATFLLAENKKQTLIVKSQTTSSTSVEQNVKLLSEKIDSLQKELEILKQQVETKLQDLQETSSSLIELNRKIERVNQDIVDILKKIESLTNEISYLKREDIQLKQSIETTKTSTGAVIYEKSETRPIVSSSIEFDDFEVINKKIEQVKKEVEDIKEQQKFYNVAEIKDPNLRRIITSPYLVFTTLLISIFALIAAF